MITSTLYKISWFSLFLFLLNPLNAAHLNAPITTTFKSFSKRLPDLLSEKIEAYHRAQKPINTIAFSASGQWVLVAKDYRYYSKKKFFDDNGIRPQIETWLREKKRIDLLAIAPNDEWVMISGRQQKYSNPSYFDRIGLKGKLAAMRRTNQQVRTLALGPKGSWVVVGHTGKIYFSNNLSQVIPTLWQLLVDCKNHSRRPVNFINIQSVKNFAPGGQTSTRWVLVADDYYWSENWSKTAQEELQAFRRKKWAVDFVALSPLGGWSIISNQRFRPKLSNQKANRFENGFKKKGVISTVHIEERMAHHRVPGVSIVIIDQGNIVLSRGYGRTKALSDQPVLAGQTRFPVASLSKMPASMALLHLIGQKPNWQLDEPLAKIVSRFTRNKPQSDFMRWYNKSEKAKAKKVTTHQLLSHSAGLGLHGIGQNATYNVSSLYNILKDDELVFLNAPGQYWDYSGGGYTVAEALLEAVSGKSFEQYCQEALFEPLDMDKSHFKPSGFQDSYYAYGHNSRGKTLTKKDCPGEAAGGLICTAIDYSHLVMALMNNGRYEGRSVLPKYLIDEMMTNTVKEVFAGSCSSRCNGICYAKAGTTQASTCATPLTGYSEDEAMDDDPVYYGIGIFVDEELDAQNYPKFVSHGGKQTGYYARFWAYKSENTAIIILTNGTKEWTDSKGIDRGAWPLIQEIRKSFNTVYR